MAEEKKELSAEQKAYTMLQAAMGQIAVETGLITEYTVVPQVKFREATEEEKKKVEEARQKHAEAAKKQAEKEEE